VEASRTHQPLGKQKCTAAQNPTCSEKQRETGQTAFSFIARRLHGAHVANAEINTATAMRKKQRPAMVTKEILYLSLSGWPRSRF
jgi:hypothetical protein